MSFLIFALAVKFHPRFVDVVLFPFHIFWRSWLQGVDAAKRNFYVWEEEGEKMNRLLVCVCFR